MTDRLLGLVGLGLRAGQVIVGVDAVRAELQRNGIQCVVMASDASPRALEKVSRLAKARGIPIVEAGKSAALGARLGRPPVMVAGVRDPKLAAGILAAGQPAKQ